MLSMRTLILLSALPGSGKSTWAAKYQKANPKTKIVSSDEIRQELFGKAQDFRDEALVWKTFLERLNRYGDEDENATVIADATNLQNVYRVMYCKQTPRFDRHVLIYLDLPFEVCCRQNRMRDEGRIVPEAVMRRFKDEFEPISDEVKELYDEVVTVRDFAPIY